MREEEPEPRGGTGSAPERVTLKEGEDYYCDGPYIVFTERYHLKRGVCCNSGCRHCPYREKPSSSGLAE